MSEHRRNLLEVVAEELRLRNYSPKTIKAYKSTIRALAKHFAPRHPRELSEEDIREYLLYLLQKKRYAASTVNQVINALRFLYVDLYGKPFVLGEIPRPKKSRNLPKVLSETEVRAILDSTSNLKHKALLMLVYSAGLRVGEVVRIKLEDIDSTRMLIHIRKAKGLKDRYVQLSETVLSTLREYWRHARPREWLFPGQGDQGFLSERTAEEVFKQATTRAGIRKPVSIHSLRHSYATHLLEAGVDIRYIQEILGHSNLKTTEIYTHVSKKQIAKVVNPLDRMFSQTK
ncbi:MAG TPA: site-specific tyrosine recombinase/integron integrase [Bacteroidota bacterium]|nr:site-specific tyrosine recombinase/integron integrase [Bacteroidota bacterium]